MMLQKGKEKCFYQPCSIGSTFTPKPQGKFLATENFFHTFKRIGQSERRDIKHLMKKLCCSIASLQHILLPYFRTVLESLWMMKGNRNKGIGSMLSAREESSLYELKMILLWMIRLLHIMRWN
ncbi:probable apyrase 4 [Rosa rugosa]|uniref:probable apyrase 4 n=1 Tax=Rosa rugosa TaxID=74645 RepID=UPI002B410A1E|nr:probable apyrase 4 [Rosa rugosa]